MHPPRGNHNSQDKLPMNGHCIQCFCPFRECTLHWMYFFSWRVGASSFNVALPKVHLLIRMFDAQMPFSVHCQPHEHKLCTNEHYFVQSSFWAPNRAHTQSWGWAKDRAASRNAFLGDRKINSQDVWNRNSCQQFRTKNYKKSEKNIYILIIFNPENYIKKAKTLLSWPFPTVRYIPMATTLMSIPKSVKQTLTNLTFKSKSIKKLFI